MVDKLDFRKGEKDIYKRAKRRKAKINDINVVKCTSIRIKIF